MELKQTNDQAFKRDEILARAKQLAARQPVESCSVRNTQVRAYRGLVAEINALTDNEMKMALLSR